MFNLISGILPGSKFGFNKNGLIFGSNNILQKEINLSGIRKCVFILLIFAGVSLAKIIGN